MKARRSRLQPPIKQNWSTRFKSTATFFVLEVLAVTSGIAALGFAGWEFYQARLDRQALQQDREADAVARAWAVLASQVSGNSGKNDALEYLVSRGVVLDGIDLSCRTMGGMNDEGTLCLRPTFLRDLSISSTRTGLVPSIFIRTADFSDTNLTRAQLVGVNLSNATFSGATLNDSDLQWANLSETEFNGSDAERVNFNEAHLWRASFEGANLSSASFDGEVANLWYVNFNGADLSLASFVNTNASSSTMVGADLFRVNFRRATLVGADFSGAHLTQADFTGANVEAANWDGAWAFAHGPPQGLSIEIDLCRSDAASPADGSTRPEPCVPP